MLTKNTISCCLLAAAALLAAVPARAASVGVNFAPAGSAGILAATTSAGVAPYAQTNYNNVTANGTNLVLNDNTGAATTARLTLAATGFRVLRTAVAGADETLNNGYAYGSDSLTLTLTGIPYASYVLVVYDLYDLYDPQSGGYTRPITVGGTSYWTTGPDPTSAGYVDNNAATAFTYTRGTGKTGATATLNADYVLFTGLSGSSQTITATFGGNFGEISGFQIIQVPEPSAWAACAVGASLCAWTVRLDGAPPGPARVGVRQRVVPCPRPSAFRPAGFAPAGRFCFVKGWRRGIPLTKRARFGQDRWRGRACCHASGRRSSGERRGLSTDGRQRSAERYRCLADGCRR